MNRKFQVEIQRVSVRTKTIMVEAESEGEAEDKAYEQAGNEDFTDAKEVEADYDVIDIKEAGSR